MMIRLWWAAVASVMLLGLSACGEVESCKRGEDIGCLDSPPDPTTGRCRFGLVPNAQGSACVKPSDVNGGAPGRDSCGGCATGSVCNQLTNKCVDVCKLPDSLPATKGAPRACRPRMDNDPATQDDPPFTFEQAAQRLCEQECFRRNEYCGGGCDPNTFCSTPAAMGLLAQLRTQCMTTANPVECVMTACEASRDRPCTSVMCPSGAQPNCAGVVCTNNCPTGDPTFVNDGVCDDGDLSNGVSAVCDWGTDCGDCGPRRGTRPPQTVGYGDLCVDPIQCGGNTSDVNRAQGWCVRFELSVDLLRCVPDCSNSQPCPSGFECTSLSYEENGMTMPLTDLQGKTAKACFPTMSCGN